MDTRKLNELADTAAALAGQSLTVQPGEPFKEWDVAFRGLLASYFANGQLETSIAAALDPKAIGKLTMDSEWLARRQTLTSDARPMTRDKLNRVAAILRGAGKKAEAEPAQLDAAAPRPIYRVGDWRLLDEPLGRGGQGSVVLVWHESRFVHGALKRPRGDRVLTPKAKTRFLREIGIFKSIKHPFILRILDSGEDKDADLFLVTEVAPFGSLKDNAHVFVGDVWRTLRLARDIARGLSKVHGAGIVHRDLKPENLLLYSLDHPLVGDFGIAHLADKEGVTSVDEKVGSYWFSPREYEMKGEPTPAFDVFSLGAIMHWTLAGISKLDEPYRVMNERASLAERFDTARFKPLDDLLDRMMHDEPGKRLQSMDAVVKQIDEILGGLLGGAGFGTDCVFCGKGKYRRAGAVRAGSGTEINVWKTNQDGSGLFKLEPELFVCDACGDLRLRAKNKPF